MSKVKSGIYGLCVADALGVPAECRTRDELRMNPITGMVGGGIHGQNPGCWSDDSSMTLCLAESIGKAGYFHTHDIMARFDDWCKNGAYTPGGKKFDIGNTCARAISRYRRGCTPALCGSNKFDENGNGSLMRILPLAFPLYGKYGKDILKHKQAMEDIHKISGLTHRHPLAQSACGIYLAIAVRILDGYPLNRAICEGIDEALDWYASHNRFSNIIEHWSGIADTAKLQNSPNTNIYSGGFVVETMETAIWCLLNTDSYRACVLECVNMGYDADSTAAIAGGLAGIYYGFENIPVEWVEALEGKETIDRCIASLEHYCHINNTYSYKTYWDYDRIRRTAHDSCWRTPLDSMPKKRNLDKFLGCLIGGAAGDALGYPVEFLSEPFLRAKYGEQGITEYQLNEGLARISDDTQMTLFTANGLLLGYTRGHLRGIKDSLLTFVAAAYREWFKTQVETFEHSNREFATCWLLNVKELFAERAPGNTCMSAIDDGCCGTIERPANGSKGCGGVMRVAPVGLFCGEEENGLASDFLAADIAALTHGHEMGYIPAALFSHIVRLVSHNDEITLKQAVLDGMEGLKKIFPYARHLPSFLLLMEKAVKLSECDTDDLTAIHRLGNGWCGNDALAIAVYCALKYSRDFDKALITAVNHGGDSDSTGAIAGNILGAYLGASAIPRKYTEHLELLDVITEMGEDLYYRCQFNEFTGCRTPRDRAWLEKYVEITYPAKVSDENLN